jgi:osmotically-inducible protein OsmY
MSMNLGSKFNLSSKSGAQSSDGEPLLLELAIGRGLCLSDNFVGKFRWGVWLMSRFRFASCVVLPLALPIVLGGCPVAIVGGLAAAGGAGYAANQERGAGGVVDDLTIKTNIQNAWLHTNPLMQRDFDVTVYEGRTLLTGTTSNPEMKAQAKEIASRTPGVRTVYDEIEVAPGEGAWQNVRDTWITSQIRSNLVFASDVRSTNYTIETVNNSVYLIGSARDQAELDRVTNAARNVPNVKRVVSYIQIRPGAPAIAESAGAPPASRAQGPDAPLGAPTAAVEAQKL